MDIKVARELLTRYHKLEAVSADNGIYCITFPRDSKKGDFSDKIMDRLVEILRAEHQYKIEAYYVRWEKVGLFDDSPVGAAKNYSRPRLFLFESKDKLEAWEKALEEAENNSTSEEYCTLV